MEPSDYEWLVEGLEESREDLRMIKVLGEQRQLRLAWAFYRVEAAAAAIRELVAQNVQLQVSVSSREERGLIATDLAA